MIRGFCLAVLLLTPTAHAAEASPFSLGSQWTLLFRSAGSGGMGSGGAATPGQPGGTTFTVVSVEQSAGTERGFGLVAGQRKYNTLTVLSTTDGSLMVADLTVSAANQGKLRVCAFGTLRPPQRSGLKLLIPPGQLDQAMAALRKKLGTLRSTQPGINALTALRRAAGPSADGSTCTLRRLR
ncbi:hypothetical protein [Deinococcus koreensis]|uniref:Uncharacterized protein n=1 Tax=Deinococcus koreensis TaxID=2054903 RepID=A0A2K3UUP1_9DEIO|nr:hypothetical protein [Deinococcus koreensis]PNY80249.1 hypothetical protein CVO96_01730 [Deinococcus koreensis]